MEIKSDLVFCGVCRKECTKTFSKLRGKNSIYVDDKGEEWSGRKCPECYSLYKASYDAKRRAKLGHRSLGATVRCEGAGCSNTLVVSKGTHRLCPDCKKKATE